MANDFSQMDILSYIAKYVDENGCTFKQACLDLEIDFTEDCNDD